MNLAEFKEIYDKAQICLYMSTEGVTIRSSSDPIVAEGSVTPVLHTEIDNTSNCREYPFIGERLDNYHVNRDTGHWYATPSHWVVWRVESFNSVSDSHVIREVVIVWCKKDPIHINQKEK